MTPQRIPLKLTLESCQDLKNLYLDTDLGQLDCLSSITGIGDYPQVEQNSIKVDLTFGTCRILSIDGLIAAKQTMTRHRDRDMLIQLKAIKERSDT